MRRSPAVYCYTPLPLDLHVLSLPLAFILSQDQTLHCKNCLFILPLTRLVSLLPPRDRSRTHAISMSQNFYVLSFPGQLPTGGVFLESGCKDTTFFQTAKIFFNYFLPPHTTGRTTSSLRPKFFFVYQHAVRQHIYEHAPDFIKKIFLQFEKRSYLCTRFRRKNGPSRRGAETGARTLK